MEFDDMYRIQKIVGHLDNESRVQIEAAQAMTDVRHGFHMSVQKMEHTQMYFLQEMMEGLNHYDGHIKMLPSFVEKRNTSDIEGDFFALDLGGTNFRVLRVSIVKGVVTNTTAHPFKIPLEHMTGTAEGLFGFIAKCVKEVAPEGGGGEKMLGFTFSFPCEQEKIDSGVLINWTKGFTTKGVEGEDVCALLETAFKKIGLNFKVSALCNDTVGTLVTEYFKDNKSAIGVILGTGANACYWEKVKNIPKYMKKLSEEEKARVLREDTEMVINMECGNFDSGRFNAALPVTPYDDIVDFFSPNPGKQRLEKMLSGMYLGEIARSIFVFLTNKSVLPTMVGMSARGACETWELSHILADKSEDLGAVGAHMQKKYSCTTSMGDRKIIREVCELVCERSARLAACMIGIVAKKMGVHNDCTVAIDGSVFEKIPGYKGMIEEGLGMLAHGAPVNIKLVLTKEGSGVGAGLISALVASGGQ